MSRASCGCGRQRFAIRVPISANMRSIGEAEAETIARDIWTRINLRNLQENILPTRARASLVLTKDASHSIEAVELRKL